MLKCYRNWRISSDDNRKIPTPKSDWLEMWEGSRLLFLIKQEGCDEKRTLFLLVHQFGFLHFNYMWHEDYILIRQFFCAWLQYKPVGFEGHQSSFSSFKLYQSSLSNGRQYHFRIENPISWSNSFWIFDNNDAKVKTIYHFNILTEMRWVQTYW